MSKKNLAALALIAFLVSAGPAALPSFATNDLAAFCEEAEDHELAFLARQIKVARPLAEILEEIGSDLGSMLIDIEIECEENDLQYELKIRTPTGRIVEILIDARTGARVETED